ncbi:hypothetical protein PAXRUDRAFT_833878 [Paxillus rubicundulus Ve08.2h10]|uniref:Uncharacterized protein n=1 Tax=Paxillus rubicundulus Ve08.2h10 TaxID=930991 RepID=A0A0D0D879_9AGAM|nr:hypothetical protein PAXRUDRAFT_833878 [Paxillus rubicundulus Ve08.2h10]
MTPWSSTPHSCPSPTLTPRNGPSTSQMDLSSRNQPCRLANGPVTSKVDPTCQGQAHHLKIGPITSNWNHRLENEPIA